MKTAIISVLLILSVLDCSAQEAESYRIVVVYSDGATAEMNCSARCNVGGFQMTIAAATNMVGSSFASKQGLALRVTHPNGQVTGAELVWDGDKYIFTIEDGDVVEDTKLTPIRTAVQDFLRAELGYVSSR